MLCRTCRTDNEPSAAICQNCGRSLTALARGELLAGRFEIRAVIGSGGMGIVYKAHDRSLEEDVALKVLRPEFASTREAARRFQSEIKLARKVSDRHVCRIFEYGEDAGLRYICMELVDGVNLKQQVQDHGPLPPTRPTRRGSRSPTASPPSTRPGSSTATSRPRTSCATRAASSASWTSASPASWSRWASPWPARSWAPLST